MDILVSFPDAASTFFSELPPGDVSETSRSSSVGASVLRFLFSFAEDPVKTNFRYDGNFIKLITSGSCLMKK